MYFGDGVTVEATHFMKRLHLFNIEFMRHVTVNAHVVGFFPVGRSCIWLLNYELAPKMNKQPLCEMLTIAISLRNMIISRLKCYFYC